MQIADLNDEMTERDLDSLVCTILTRSATAFEISSPLKARFQTAVVWQRDH